MSDSDLIAERQISRKAFIGPVAGATIYAVAVFAILIGTGKGVSPGWALVALLPLPLTLLQAFLLRLSVTYRLFRDRLEVESGLTSRRIENVDLFRVRDLGVRQHLLGRLLNYGDVYLYSTDASSPELYMRNIDDPATFYRQMRQLVDASRAQRQTMIVEDAPKFSE